MAESYDSPENPNKPNQIDVSLSLIGSDSRVELTALTTALKELKAALNIAAAPTTQAAQNAARSTLDTGSKVVSDSPNQSSGIDVAEAAERVRRTQESAQRASTGQSEQPTAEMPPIETIEEDARQQLNYTAGGRTGVGRAWTRHAARKATERQEEEAEQAGPTQQTSSERQHQRDYEATSQRPDGRSAPSGGGRVPPEAQRFVGGEVPGWMGASTEATLEMPRFGEYTSQELLAKSAEIAKVRAIKKFAGSVDELMEGGMTPEEAQAQATAQGVGNTTGGVGQALAFASRKMPYFAAANRLSEFGTAASARAGVDVTTGSLQQMGTQMGESTPQWDYNLLPFGPTLNFDAPKMLQPLLPGAQNKAFREKWKAALGDREFKNVSSSKRQEILSEAVAHGRGRDDGRLNRYQEAAYKSLNQKGLQDLSADSFGKMYDQDLRHGQTSMNDFIKTVRDIPAAAKAARMGTEEYVQSLIGVGEQFSNSMGATANKGRSYGNSFATATGADPALGALLLKNPMIQGQLMRETQILPNAQGAISNSTLMRSSVDTIKLMRKQYESSFKDKTEEHAWGNTTVTAAQQADAAVLELFPGMALEQYKDLMGGAKTAEKAANLTEVATANRKQMLAHKNDPGYLEKIKHGGIKKETGKYGIASNAEVTAAMREAGFKDKEINSVWDIKAVGGRANKIQEILAARKEKTDNTKDDNKTKVAVDVQLGFSKDARFWVNEVSRKVHTSTGPGRNAKDGKEAVDVTNADQVSPYLPSEIINRVAEGVPGAKLAEDVGDAIGKLFR